MRWIGIVLAGLAGLVALMAVCGLLLPKGHVAAGSRRLAAPPDAVWAIVSDLAGWPAWNRAVARMERLPDGEGRERWAMHDRHGDVLRSEVVERVAPRRLVTRILPGLPFGGSWTWAIEPDGGGSRVTLTEVGEVYNPIFRFLARFVFGHHRTIEQFLAALDARAGG